MKVLDLFCGAGGMSSGFRKAGFKVTGADINQDAGRAFLSNGIGQFVNADLSTELVDSVKYDIVVGGPPCKPWSSVNLIRRAKSHRDYKLVRTFFNHVEHHLPEVFMLENVPPLKSDPMLLRCLKKMEKLNYSTRSEIVQYSNFGTSTARKRLIVFGIRNGNPDTFFDNLELQRARLKVVKDAIWKLRTKDRDSLPDHIWPRLSTINKYLKYYKHHKYGWYILEWAKPAPSFGNVMKTYILHPDSFVDIQPRVISIKEALLIMGFDESFNFPNNMGIGSRYQMVADSVSPKFSYAASKAILNTIS